MADCTGTTKQGKPCRNRAKRGETLCASHLGIAHRPTLLGDDVLHKVTAFLRNGNFVEPACEFAGVSVGSYYAWRTRGKADQEAGITNEFSEFFEATTRAIAEGELTAVAKLQQNVAAGDQRAIEFYLERRHGKRWGRQDRMDLQHSGDLRTDVLALPDDEAGLREVYEILRDIGVLPGDLDA